MPKSARGPITIYAPRRVSVRVSLPGGRFNFRSRLKTLISVLIVSGVVVGLYPLIGEVWGVITEGGSAVTLDQVLDENFNLSLVGYLEGTQLKSTATSGAPLTVASTELVTDLNADLLDGQHGNYYLDWDNATDKPTVLSSLEGVSNNNGNIDLIAGANMTITASDIDNTITLAASAGIGGWVDDGTVVRLETATDWVGIGTAIPGATLDVRGNAVFNENGDDNDFRIEGATDANLFIVNAGLDSVQIGVNGLPGGIAEFSSSQIIFGQGGGVEAPAVDFTVAGELNADLFQIDAGTNTILIDGGNTASFSASGIVFNDVGSAAIDIRFEGATDANLLYLDATANFLGIGTDVPDGKLHVFSGSAGVVTAASTSDDLVIENSGIVGMSLLTANASQTFFSMGSPADNNEAEMYWLDETGWFFFYKNNQYLGLRASELVLNEGGADIDLRVEGTAEANALFVDGSNGRVGIGNNAPSQTLTVADVFVGYVGSFFNDGNNDNRQGVFIQGCLDVNPTAACNFLELRDGDGGVLGAIEGNGSGGVTNASTGSDYAELFSGNRVDFERGDLIALGDQGRVVPARPGTRLVGAYSSTPATLGNWRDGWENSYNVVPVGLLGQLRVKVSTEKGPIRKGDPITNSPSQPGVGVKAAEAGRILGFALESTTSDQHPSSVTLLLVYVSPSWYDPDDSEVVVDEEGDAAQINPDGSITKIAAETIEAKEGIFEKITATILGTFEKIVAKTVEITSAVIESLSAKVAEFGKLTVGDSVAPTGITIYDRANGEPYCVSVVEGAVTSEPGACE